MDYFNRGSTEDYVAASFTSTECGKKMVKRVKWPGETNEAPTGTECGAGWQTSEDVQVVTELAESEEHTSAKSSRCQHTTKQKQRAVLYAQQYYSAPTIGGWSIYAF